ncbi:SDR family NAD(P)-dependent oxidoreductase [Roseibium algae]|uniref:SDR family oxidoreductase n=1 Tax=Roseibium algae TaxID=3123038 RepID=A0ABU8TGP5_9HYPH
MSEIPAFRSIVTGAAGALGQRIVNTLRARGDQVIGLDRVVPDNAPVPFFQVDINDPQSVKDAMEAARVSLGGLDVLVHAAGILRSASFLEITEEDMAAHLDTNVRGAVRIAQSAARMMLEDGGRIVFITSIHGQVGVANRGAYAASKGAIASLARVIAVELAPYRIRINVLAPGAVDGGMGPDPGTRSNWISATPSHRVAHLDEVARAAALLTSDDASFITGQTIAVDGGVSTLRSFSE